MADNLVLNAGAGGSTLATDDIGGIHYQIVKVSFGALDTATPASAANPLPVVQTGTHTVTGAGGTFPVTDSGGTLTVDAPVATPVFVRLSDGAAAISALPITDNAGSITVDGTVAATQSGTWNIGSITTLPALVAGTNNIGDVDVLTVPTDPFGANADAASASGSISAKLRFIASTGIPITGTATVTGAGGTFPATQSGTWSMRLQDGSGNAITSAARGSERAATVQIVDATGTQVTSFGGSGTPSAVSSVNSTAVVLAGAAAFTGTSEDVTAYSSVTVSVIASHASATDGLSMQQSSDGTNWDIVDAYTVPAATGKTFGVQVAAKFFRVVYTNGATLQTSFRLQTMYHTNMQNSSSVRPQDARTNDNDMTEVIAYSALYNGTTWDRQRGDTTNGLDVDVTRLPALVTGSATIGAVNIAAAQTLATVTTVGTVTTVSTLTNITNWGNVVDDAAFTPATTRVSMSGYQADETATDSVDEGDGGAARMTLDRKQIITVQPHTQGGTLIATGSITNTATSVKASAGQVYGWYFYNPNASVAYVQFFNTVAGSVTLGTTPPVYSLGIPATSAANVSLTVGVEHTTAIVIGVTTTRAGSTAPGSSVDFNVFYK